MLFYLAIFVPLIVLVVLTCKAYRRFTIIKGLERDRIQLAAAWPIPLKRTEQDIKESRYKFFIEITCNNGKKLWGAFRGIGICDLQLGGIDKTEYGINFIWPSGLPGGGSDWFVRGSDIQKVEQVAPPEGEYWL